MKEEWTEQRRERLSSLGRRLRGLKNLWLRVKEEREEAGELGDGLVERIFSLEGFWREKALAVEKCTRD